MRKLLISLVALVLLVAFLVSGYSRIEVVGYTKDAVKVTVVVVYWSLGGRDAEFQQKKAVWLALTEVFVQQIYADGPMFRETVARHSLFWTISVKTVIPTETLEKLKTA